MEYWRLTITVTVLAVAAILIFLFVPPIAQDENYHAFADARTVWGVPNFWNVISNVPFAFIGILGLRKARGSMECVLFAGVFLTCFGSAYYHLAPSDARLVWDRLPMTLVFMSLLSGIVLVHKGPHRDFFLWLFVFCGITSVVWWQITGDLRLYALVQFGPMAVLPLALPKAENGKYLGAVLGLYALAKCAEHFDHQIYSCLPISGHTFKHFLSSFSSYWIFRWRMVLDASRMRRAD